MPRFSAHLTQLFTERPFEQRFAAAAQAGFGACEFRSPYEHPPEAVANWLADSGLVNVLFNAPAGNWAAGERGIAALPGREEEFRRGVAQALRYAEALDTPMIHVMAGIVRGDADRLAHRRIFVANLRHAAEAAARSGRTVVIEPINPRDVPGYFLTHQADAHAIREEVDAANLRVQMDLYHAQIVEGDLATKIRRHLPHIAHVQIAGVPGRHEPDEGEVDYAYLLRLLDTLGYAGWVGCEYVPRGRTEEGLGWLDTFARIARHA